jgi:predicted dehydrogenase
VKRDDVEIVALADPVSRNRQVMAKISDIPSGYIETDDWRDLLNMELDGVVIASPNFLHREMAVPFIKKGIPVALEKPMTTTMEDSEMIMDAARESGTAVLIGFVLRSTPFYGKIYELLNFGTIGHVVAIEADELAGYGETSTISRRHWRRYSKFSGGSLMEKSCHDMDLMNWLTNSRPVALNSFGGTLVFNHNPLLPEKCSECKLEDCVYRTKSEFVDADGNPLPGQFARDDIYCIYNMDKDVVDNQSVNVQYENGTIVNFLMSFNCAGEKAARNFHAIGQKGRLWGNIRENEVFVYLNATDKVTKYELFTDGTGHSGGDERHALELVKMMADRNYRPEQDAYAGYLSNALCIGADTSRNEGRRINFRYHAHGYISFE